MLIKIAQGIQRVQEFSVGKKLSPILQPTQKKINSEANKVTKIQYLFDKIT